MDVISRLLDCDGQAADAISAYTQVKWMTLKSYLKFQNQNVRMCGYVLQNIHGRSHGNTLRILLFFLNETFSDNHSQDSCGKESSKKHGWNVVGKKYPIRNAFRSQKYSYRSMWMTSKCPERSRIQLYCGRN